MDIPTTTTLRSKDTEDEQVKELKDRKGRFSASSMYTNVGTMCINSGAVLKAQMYQLENNATEEKAKNQKNNETQNKNLLDVKTVKEIYKKVEKISGGQMKSYHLCSTGGRMH